MKKRHIMVTLLAGIMAVSVLAGCSSQPADMVQDTLADAGQEENSASAEGETALEALMIARQGMFSSGGTITEPVEGEYDPTTNWMDTTRAGNTAHVDHANVFYQIPANDNGNPMVYLHGYGQSRMGWMTTPDGREGWSDLFLKKGYASFLADQPRRGEAGHKYPGLSHGFGLGTGTAAEGWIEDAVAFWEKQMQEVRKQDEEEKNYYRRHYSACGCHSHSHRDEVFGQ